MVVDVLKVLAWPGVAVVAAVALILVVRGELRGLVRRIARVKVGSNEFTTQAERSRELPPPATTTTVEPADEAQLPTGAEAQPAAGDCRLQALEEMVRAEQARAAIWEYRYLNQFLVFNTQLTLDWIISQTSRPSVGLLDAQMHPVVPEPQERLAILSALMSHALILVEDGLVQATPKGREYARWRGPLPAPPRAPAAAAS